MKNVTDRTKSSYTTLKLFLVCFAVYFVCNTYK